MSSPINDIGNVAIAKNAIDKMKLNGMAMTFAKDKNDKDSIAARKSYRNYWIFSITLAILAIAAFFHGMYEIDKYYAKLNSTDKVKYSEVVVGKYLDKYFYTPKRISYFKKVFKEIRETDAVWNSKLKVSEGTKLNIFLDENLEPVYISIYYEKYYTMFIYGASIVLLWIIGIVLTIISAKKFADYINWFVYMVLPIITDENYEEVVKNAKYQKISFSTKGLNTKEAMELRKANRTQIICGIAFIVIIIFFVIFGEQINKVINAEIVLLIFVIPFAIIAVNADHKSQALKGIVAEQNINKIKKNSKTKKA